MFLVSSIYANEVNKTATQKNIKTKNQLKVLTTKETFEMFKVEIEDYAKKNNGKIPIGLYEDKEIVSLKEEIADGLYEDMYETVFVKNQVEDYSKLIADTAPETVEQIALHKAEVMMMLFTIWF